MKCFSILFTFLSIFSVTTICNAQEEHGYAATFCSRAPGVITKAELLEIASQKNAIVNLKGGKNNCEMTNFSISIATLHNNNSLYYEQIKGEKLSKNALEYLKHAEAGNKIILSGFKVKCGKEREMIKQEFVYNIVE